MTKVLGALQAFKKTAVDEGDQRWDKSEIQKLAKLAKGDGDTFTAAGRSFLSCELHGKTEIDADAKQTLVELLAASSAEPTARRHEAVLAVQEGGSNKFYALAVEGNTLHTRWGPIGKDGQSKEESFSTPKEADLAFTKALRAKLAKGYQAADPEALGIAPATKSGPPKDLASFLALPQDRRDEILDWSESAKKAGLEVVEGALSELKDPKHRAFAERLRDAASDATGGFEIHDDEYTVVGDPRISVELYVLPSGEIAGGEVHAFQQGCETPDDYWDNEEKYTPKELQKLADATDVSWSATGRYENGKDGELRTLSDPDYMEWSGY